MCADPEDVHQGGQERGREADPGGVEAGPQQLGGPHQQVKSGRVVTYRKPLNLQSYGMMGDILEFCKSFGKVIKDSPALKSLMRVYWLFVNGK